MTEDACRICLDCEKDDMISPCACKGSMSNVHRKCLYAWMSESVSLRCSTCRHTYAPGVAFPWLALVVRNSCKEILPLVPYAAWLVVRFLICAAVLELRVIQCYLVVRVFSQYCVFCSGVSAATLFFTGSAIEAIYTRAQVFFYMHAALWAASGINPAHVGGFFYWYLLLPLVYFSVSLFIYITNVIA